MSMQPRHVEAGPEDAGQRIDNYLRRVIKGAPKGLIYRLLRTGQVRVNRRRIRAHYRLEEGDQVRIPPVSERASRSGRAPEGLQASLGQRILYEDDRLLVINKPSGVPVHAGSGLDYGLIDALRQARPSAHYLELVHRLDRETSGCLIIAKRRSTLRRMHAQLREGKVEKRYWTLLAGNLPEARRVRASLQRRARGSGENRVVVDDGGKASLTHLVPVRQWRDWTLVEAILETGRTHQIRVHAAHVGLPVAGDERYGDRNRNRMIRRLGLRRLFLHASRLQFDHPDRPGQVVSVEAPLEERLEAVLEKLDREEN